MKKAFVLVPLLFVSAFAETEKTPAQRFQEELYRQIDEEAFQLARQGKAVEAYEVLGIEKGSMLSNTTMTSSSKTLLQWAIERRDAGAVKIILDYEASSGKFNSLEGSMVDVAVYSKIHPTLGLRLYYTPLHYAIAMGDIEVAVVVFAEYERRKSWSSVVNSTFSGLTWWDPGTRGTYQSKVYELTPLEFGIVHSRLTKSSENHEALLMKTLASAMARGGKISASFQNRSVYFWLLAQNFASDQKNIGDDKFVAPPYFALARQLLEEEVGPLHDTLVASLRDQFNAANDAKSLTALDDLVTLRKKIAVEKEDLIKQYRDAYVQYMVKKRQKLPINYDELLKKTRKELSQMVADLQAKSKL